MNTVIIVIHLMVVVALVVVVLLQRSEGGALGIGGGGGLMTGRGTANALTRVTAVLAFVFFATSMTLTILAGHSGGGSILDQLRDTAPPAEAPQGEAPVEEGAGEGGGGVLDELRQQQPSGPQVPQSE